MTSIAAALLVSLAQADRQPQVIWPDFVITRPEWGAKPALSFGKSHSIHLITIHHGGVASNPKRSLEDKLRGLQSWSQRADKLAGGKEKPAWVDIPYHVYISIDGRVGEARPWNLAGDTNTEYNPTGHFLIVLEGNFEVERVPSAQWESLVKMTAWAANTFSVSWDKIEGHDDHSAQTTCPGKDLKRQLPRLRSLVRRDLGR